MKALIAALFALSLIIPSCSERTATTEDEATKRDSTITISGLGRELLLNVPVDLARSYTLQSWYNTTTGEVEITAGENLRVLLTEESLSIAELKAELDTDIFYRYRYESANPNELIFVQILPDGTEYSYQFIRRYEIPGITVISRSDPSGKYTKQDIQTMMNITGKLESAAS
jgi:hypothetical protein